VAWLAYNAENDGVGCDERPEEVAAIFEDTVGTWAKLHDRGKPMFVDPRAVYWICPDDEEIEKDTNLEWAAANAEAERKDAEDKDHAR
jgi:hypothetical protein